MRLAFVLLLLLHGAIHLLGFLIGCGWVELASPKLPLGMLSGGLWLLATLGFIATAVLLFATPERWWLCAIPTLILSQALILWSWSDAKFGTIPNLIALVPVLIAVVQSSPNSFRSTYRRESASRLALLAASSSPKSVTEKDLALLPPLVQTFLRRAGVVGKPRVGGFHARFHGRIRQGMTAPWMDFTSDQHNFVNPSARFFYISASVKGVPFDGLHAFAGNQARMQIRIASLFDVVDGQGPEMNQGETVTIFNDLCVLAPAALLEVPVTWTTLDTHSVQGVFTRGDQTISAVLTFNDQGDLVNFVSQDRFLSADGKKFQKLPWSTPLTDHREIGGYRLPTRGDATWKTPEGSFVYGEFKLEEIECFPPSQP